MVPLSRLEWDKTSQTREVRVTWFFFPPLKKPMMVLDRLGLRIHSSVLTWTFLHERSVFEPGDLGLGHAHGLARQRQSAAAVHRLVGQVLTQPRAAPRCGQGTKRKRKKKKPIQTGCTFVIAGRDDD